MLPVLQLGGVAIPLPPLVVLLSLWVALDVAQRQAARRGLDGEKTYSLAFNSLVSGLLAARLAYVLVNLDAYLAIRPVGRMIVSFVTPLLGSEIPLIGLGVGLGVAVFYIRRYEFDWKRAADAYAIGAAVFAVGLWLANLFGGDGYGVETRLPWGVNLWGARRHPTQVYNILASAVILFVVWRVEPTSQRDRGQADRRLTWTAPYDGFVAHLFVTLTSVAILLLEPLRGDSLVISGGYRAWQVGALVALVACLILFAWRAPARPNRETART